jgi:hypothetical protein
VPANHDGDPIILTGLDFPDWSARSNQTAKLPLTDVKDCNGTIDPSRGSSPNDWLVADPDCAHNNYVTPEVDTGDALGDGMPVDRLFGYRWNGKEFVQIPFQVDETFTRYLDSGGLERRRRGRLEVQDAEATAALAAWRWGWARPHSAATA